MAIEPSVLMTLKDIEHQQLKVFCRSCGHCLTMDIPTVASLLGWNATVAVTSRKVRCVRCCMKAPHTNLVVVND